MLGISSAGGKRGGGFGGPGRGGKGSFNLPKLTGCTGRFCPYCGRRIFNYYTTGTCPHNLCGRVLPKEQPELPVGYRWCPRCLYTPLESNFHFCVVCHYTTPAGTHWIQLVGEHRRRIEEADLTFAAANAEFLHRGSTPPIPSPCVHPVRPHISPSVRPARPNIFPVDRPMIVEDAALIFGANNIAANDNDNDLLGTSDEDMV